ncbi:hypothetical protein ACQUFA_14700, partial [Enterococcus faecalis]
SPFKICVYLFNSIPKNMSTLLGYMHDGKFNSIYDSSFYLQFKFDKSTKLPSIKSMTSYNSFRIGGMLYE